MLKHAALALLIGTAASAQQQPWSVTQNGYAPWQADDKRMHFITGIGGGIWTYIAADLMHAKRPWLWCLLTGLAVGFAKELYDSRHHGSPELMDALNTAAGFAAPGLVFRVRW